MGSRWFEPGWFGSALALALGVPGSVFAGVAVALGLGMTLGRLLPEWAMTVIWLFGFAVAAAIVWLLVEPRIRSGGWRQLVLGLVGASAISLASYVLGAATQSVAPGVNGMAGLAWVVFGYASGIAVGLAVLMGAVASGIDRARRGREPAAVAEELPS